MSLRAHTCCRRTSRLFRYRESKFCLDDVTSAPCLWGLRTPEEHPKLEQEPSQLPRKSCSFTSSYALFASKGGLSSPIYLEAEHNLSSSIWTSCLHTQPSANPSVQPSALCFLGQTYILNYIAGVSPCKIHWNAMNCLLLEFVFLIGIYLGYILT